MDDSEFETVWGEELSEQAIAECLEIETQASQAVINLVTGDTTVQSSTSRFPPLPSASSLSQIPDTSSNDPKLEDQRHGDSSNENSEQSKLKTWKSLPIPSSSLATTEWLRSQLEKTNQSNAELLSKKQTLEGEVNLLRERNKTYQVDAAKRIESEQQKAASEREKMKQRIAELEKDLQSARVQLAFKSKQAESDFGKYEEYKKLAVLEPEVSFFQPSQPSLKRAKVQSEKGGCYGKRKAYSSSDDEDDEELFSFKVKKAKVCKPDLCGGPACSVTGCITSEKPSAVSPCLQELDPVLKAPSEGTETPPLVCGAPPLEENKPSEAPACHINRVHDSSSYIDVILKSWNWNPYAVPSGDAVFSDDQLPKFKHAKSLFTHRCKPDDTLNEYKNMGQMLSNIFGDNFFTPTQPKLKVSLSSKFEYSKQDVLKIDKMDIMLLNELREKDSIWGIKSEMTGCGSRQGTHQSGSVDEEERCSKEPFPHSKHSNYLASLEPTFTHLQALTKLSTWQGSSEFIKSIIEHITHMVHESFEHICDPLIPSRIKNKFYKNEEKIGLLFLEGAFKKPDLLSPSELCADESHLALRQSIALLSYLCAMETSIVKMIFDESLIKNASTEVVEEILPSKFDKSVPDEISGTQHTKDSSNAGKNSNVGVETGKMQSLKKTHGGASKTGDKSCPGDRRKTTMEVIKLALARYNGDDKDDELLTVPGCQTEETSGSSRATYGAGPNLHCPSVLIPLNEKDATSLLNCLSPNEEWNTSDFKIAGQWLNKKEKVGFSDIPVRSSWTNDSTNFTAWYNKFHENEAADPNTMSESLVRLQKEPQCCSKKGGEHLGEKEKNKEGFAKKNYSELTNASLQEYEKIQLRKWVERSIKLQNIYKEEPVLKEPDEISKGKREKEKITASDDKNSIFSNTKDNSSKYSKSVSDEACCSKLISDDKSFLPPGLQVTDKPAKVTSKKVTSDNIFPHPQKLRKELNPAVSKSSSNAASKKRNVAPLKNPLKNALKSDEISDCTKNLQKEVEELYQNDSSHCGSNKKKENILGQVDELDFDCPEFLEKFSAMYKRVLKTGSRLSKKVPPFSKLALAKRTPNPQDQTSAHREIIIKDFNGFGGNKTYGPPMSSQQERNHKAILDSFIREAKDYDLPALIKAFKKKVGNLPLLDGLREIIHSINFCRLTTTYYPFLLSCVNLVESILMQAVKSRNVNKETLSVLCDVLNEVSCCQPPPYILERVLDVLLMASSSPALVDCLCNKRSSMMSLIKKQEFSFFKGVCLMQPLCYLVTLSLESHYERTWRIGVLLTRWLCHLYRLHPHLLAHWYLDSYDQASHICNCVPVQHTSIFTTVSRAAAYYKNHVNNLASQCETKSFLEEIMKNGIKLCDILVRIDPLFVFNLKDFELYNDFLSNVESIHEDTILFPDFQFSYSEIFIVKKLIVAAEMALEVPGPQSTPFFLGSYRSDSCDNLIDISNISISRCDKLYQHC